MIVMPGAWRCEQHRLWTNGDCPDCDADLIASHEGQDEGMSAPLTTRDALAEAVSRVGLEWSDEDGCIRVDDEEAAEFTADMVRAITLVDGIRAEDEALVERIRAVDVLNAAAEAWSIEGRGVMFNRNGDDLTPHQRVGKWLRDLAAALSAQSERAEVER